MDELLDTVEAKGEFEVIGDLAYLLPVRVIGEMLGVPEEDHAEFKGWSAVLAKSLDPDIAVSQDEPETSHAGDSRVEGVLRGLIAKRREEPRDDILFGSDRGRGGGRQAVGSGAYLDVPSDSSRARVAGT